jgi:hypothetical protein
MGRLIVVHYRGCEIRDRNTNIQLHPQMNICEECDYFYESSGLYACQIASILKRRQLASLYGDIFLVTTPDMKDFAPNAIHFPFFTENDGNDIENQACKQFSKLHPLRLVHATNHPGIEGTKKIVEIVNRLRSRGKEIEFIYLNGVNPDVIKKQLATADLSIGKMKMGYYANFQIESMLQGVPAITWIRPEFLNEELNSSGLILSDFASLEMTLDYYYNHPEELHKKKSIAKASILKLHANHRLVTDLARIYGFDALVESKEVK